MTKVVAFGTGQMAMLLHFYLTHDSPHEVVAFTVDADHQVAETFRGLPVVRFEDVEQRYPPDDFEMSVPIMYSRLNHLRAEKYLAAKAKGYRLLSYVNSRAITWPGVTIGENTLVGDGCIIQPFATVGNNVTLCPGSIVSHHSVIEDHCFLAPQAVTLGYVRVGEYCFLGANSTIRDGVVLASECVIGAGVTIRHDTQPRQVYAPEHVRALGKPSDELRNWLTWAR